MSPRLKKIMAAAICVCALFAFALTGCGSEDASVPMGDYGQANITGDKQIAVTTYPVSEEGYAWQWNLSGEKNLEFDHEDSQDDGTHIFYFNGVDGGNCVIQFTCCKDGQPADGDNYFGVYVSTYGTGGIHRVTKD